MRIWTQVAAAVLLTAALTGCAEESGKELQVSPTAAASASPAPSATPEPSAAPSSTPTPAPSPVSLTNEADAKSAIESRAKEAVEALKGKDMKKLALLVHPDKGVQFSAYSHIDPKADVRLKASELETLWQSGDKKVWGFYDGSGEPMELSFPEYYGKFIYNQDFAAAPEIRYNKLIGKGNTVNNIFELYPQDKCVTVEYHFKGFDPQFEGNDWTSLRLTFEKLKDQWYVSAITHDQFTM